MPEKPDYVLNFSKPPRTEIKYIRGHWYLYEATSKYDPKKKRAQKISGRCLGAITSDGLTPSRPRKKKLSEKNEVTED